MASTEIKADVQAIALAAAQAVAMSLQEAIDIYGAATWVLAGGTAPMGAYQILAKEYKDKIDWEKVTVLLGDERCVPTDHPDSNWFQISQVFLDHVPIPASNKLRPNYELSAEAAATHYQQIVASLPKKENDLPRLDHVWLGMGEDGHTLSLFPGHPALQIKEPLVIPVHDSPKPPPDRISLTLRALQGTTSCLVMAAGAGKAAIIARIQAEDLSLPIVQAIQAIEGHGGQVTWLLDPAASDPGFNM